MMKVILTHIPVECGIVDSYEYRFSNGSGFVHIHLYMKHLKGEPSVLPPPQAMDEACG